MTITRMACIILMYLYGSAWAASNPVHVYSIYAYIKEVCLTHHKLTHHQIGMLCTPLKVGMPSAHS